VLRLGAPAVLAAVVLEAHGHVFSLIPVRAAVLAAALRDRALLGELPPIVSVRAEQNGVRKRPWPGASCGGCLNEGTRGPMGRKSGHGVVFMTHHRRQPGRSRTHERRRTALTLEGRAAQSKRMVTFLFYRVTNSDALEFGHILASSCQHNALKRVRRPPDPKHEGHFC